VAALFFRNEPLLSTRVPGVRREQQLNDHLREREVAVYLNDTVSDEPTEQAPTDLPFTLRDVLQNMDERNKTAPVPVGAKSIADNAVVDIPDEELDGYRPKKRRKKNETKITESPSGLRGMLLEREEPAATIGKFGSLPPLPPLPVDPSRPDVVKLPSLPVVEPGDSKVEPDADAAVSDFQPPEVFEEYVVKYGDTLSGIAQRMLGSQKKFMDIYNANQDRMASPDRLDVGKPLRIPRVAENERPTY
ncbi:MAG: LysM peptidoglycan-binding domain-containing protein, partial [Fuerstia sp.]|nr:LysM peptidoglycan-binding domain-containing protein [Fuerstiella sp.]